MQCKLVLDFYYLLPCFLKQHRKMLNALCIGTDKYFSGLWLLVSSLNGAMPGWEEIEVKSFWVALSWKWEIQQAALLARHGKQTNTPELYRKAIWYECAWISISCQNWVAQKSCRRWVYAVERCYVWLKHSKKSVNPHARNWFCLSGLLLLFQKATVHIAFLSKTILNCYDSLCFTQ